MSFITSYSSFIGENGVVVSGPRKKTGSNHPISVLFDWLFVCLFAHPFSHTCNNGHVNYYYYYWYSALGPVWAETRAQSCDRYGSGMLHPGQVLRGSLPLLSPHVNYRLQFTYYNTTYNIWTYIQYNIINNNTKFKVQLEVLSLQLGICAFIYL